MPNEYTSTSSLYSSSYNSGAMNSGVPRTMEKINKQQLEWFNSQYVQQSLVEKR